MTLPAETSGRRLSAWKVFALLLRHVRPMSRVLPAIAALTLANVLIAVAMPWPVQLLVDHVLGEHELPAVIARLLAACGVVTKTPLLVILPVAGLALYLINAMVGVAKTKLCMRAGMGSVFELRSRLLDHYQRLSLQHHYSLPMGDQLYRVSHDTYCVDKLFLEGILPLVGAALTLGGMFAVLWGLDRWLAILSLAVLPFLGICVRYYLGPLEQESEQVCQREADVLGFAGHVLGSLAMVKAFVRESHELERFREKGLHALHARLRLTTHEAWFDFAAGLVTASGTALVLVVGGAHVRSGALTVGQLLVVLAYLAAVYDPMHMISYTLGQMQAAMTGARRVLEVLETEVEPGDEKSNVKALPALKGQVVFENVTFGYQPGIRVINGVSWEAPPGSLTAIVGPTGAGKTTLTSLLLRFCHPQSGRILVDGLDIKDFSCASLRRQISIVAQESVLFPVSIAENLRYGKPLATDEELQRAAMAAHADEFIQALPNGYDTPVAEGGVTLSGGERQRLALARAFVKDAPILILDEPTSSLDAATEALILDGLERLTEHRTTIVIAHRLSTIRRADQILFLQNGSIVERGTHEELLARDGAYARLHHLYVKTTGEEAPA